jgi:hypothetical protein
MVLKIAIFLLLPGLCFGSSSYLELKKNIEILEREGTSNLTQEKVDSLNEQLSNAEDDIDELEDRFDKVVDSWAKKKISGRWNIFVSLISWTYEIDLPRTKQSLLSDELGGCGGGGYDWQNHWFGFGVDLCLGGMSGKTSINLPANLVLFVDLPVFMLSSRPRVYWRPDEKTRLVFYLPLVYRYGFSTDNISDRTLEGGDFSVGFFLGGEWEISGIVLGSSFGKILGYKSASWNFTLGYRF